MRVRQSQRADRARQVRLGAIDGALWTPTPGNTPAPLVLISHGAGGSRSDHRGTARALAAAGFMVCAVEHPGDNWRDKRLLGTDPYWYARPRQLIAALDDLLASDRFGSSIDPARIGALGFSSGGYTVLAAAGGRPDLERLRRHSADPSQDPRFCAYRKTHASDHDQAALDAPLTPDRRLKALVLVAPVGAPFGDGGLADVDAQVRLYRAGADQILAHPFHAENIHRQLTQQHDYRVIDGLHHFGFIEPLPWIARIAGVEIARDPEGFDRAKFLRALNPEIVAFFQSAL